MASLVTSLQTIEQRRNGYPHVTHHPATSSSEAKTKKKQPSASSSSSSMFGLPPPPDTTCAHLPAQHIIKFNDDIVPSSSGRSNVRLSLESLAAGLMVKINHDGGEEI
jgi:hypothetical protein